MSVMSRRNLIISATAAVGLIGALDPIPEIAAADTPSTAGAVAKALQFTVTAVNVRVLGVRTPKITGSSLTLRGDLEATAGGISTGMFFSSGSVIAPQQSQDDSVGTFENQLFSINENTPAAGTITGSGLVSHNGAGTFTITGGSGLYAGASGTYSSQQNADLSGRGAATFAFVLTK